MNTLEQQYSQEKKEIVACIPAAVASKLNPSKALHQAVRWALENAPSRCECDPGDGSTGYCGPKVVCVRCVLIGALALNDSIPAPVGTGSDRKDYLKHVCAIAKVGGSPVA